MPQPSMIHMTPEQAEAIVAASFDAGFAIMWDGQICSDITKITQIEGINYFTTNCSKCSGCKELFVKGTNENHIRITGTKWFCSGLCAHIAGYRQDAHGDFRHKPEIGQTFKHRYTQSTKISEATTEHPWLIGLEIEKEDVDLKADLDNPNKGLHIPDGWLIVHDGSIDEYSGFELVSHGYNLTAEKKEFHEALESVKDILGGHVSSGCGGHISVSEKGLTSAELTKEIRPMICFLLGLFPNRMRNSKIKMMSFAECLQAKDKYRPVNIDKNGRVELRMISAVKSHKSLMRRLEMIEWFLKEKPSFKRTAKEMEKGFLKDLFAPIYGSESWDEKISAFKKMSMWWCWDLDRKAIQKLSDADVQ